MQIIDFDAKFTDVLNDWIEKNRSRFRKPDDMENEVPDVYRVGSTPPPTGWTAPPPAPILKSLNPPPSCANCSRLT